jgi:hypothetical protein
MTTEKEEIHEFGGEARDVSPQVLPPNLFQVDHGGDRYFRGSWRRRRGMLHTDMAKFTGAVTSILGFEMAGEDFAVLIVEGSNVQGVLNVVDQDYTIPSGFGETNFGEGMGE